MTLTLQEHHRQIRAEMANIRAHLARSAPDVAELSAIRLRLSRESTARTKYVHEVLIPKALLHADAARRLELAEAQRAFSAKRLASSEHITRWPGAAIAADWAGYRAAARRMGEMMEEQMEREQGLLGSM